MTSLFEQAKQYIAGGVNSPVRAFQAVGGEPLFIQKAHGAYLVDSEGQHYIDYVGSWGPMIAGHAHPHIVEKVQQAVANGLSFGAPCEAETQLAKRLCHHVPSMEQVRFCNSGTEATMSAIRLARGFTQRDFIIKFAGCYHGHSDALLVNAGSGALTCGVPSSAGVPQGATQHTLVAEFNDIDSVQRLLEHHPQQVAAIIVEPIAGNMNCVRPRGEFLQQLRQLCTQYGSLLIFDEVMTGFRVALGGAQALYKVTPDLSTFGKVIGGGMPVGAFGGPRHMMAHLSPQGGVYQAGTLSGNPVAMAAGLATLDLIEASGFYEDLAQRTAKLLSGLQQAADRHGIPFTTQQAGAAMFGLFFSNERTIDSYRDATGVNQQHFKRFFHLMLDQSIYWAPSPFEAGFMSAAHSHELIEQTVAAAHKVFGQLY